MALTTHIALLRAVNVGGRKAIMSELRAWLAELGFEDPRSLLQSGNLVFRSRQTGAALEALLEQAAVARLGYATDFLVRTADQWRALIAANPMPQMARDDPSHLVLMPLKSAPGAAELAALREAIRGRETVEAVGRDLYLAYPDGIGDSKLTIAVIERKLGARGTGRNWNTAKKLEAMLQSP
jgi:uncharacterized protein (DUF1697 family)